MVLGLRNEKVIPELLETLDHPPGFFPTKVRITVTAQLGHQSHLVRVMVNNHRWDSSPVRLSLLGYSQLVILDDKAQHSSYRCSSKSQTL